MRILKFGGATVATPDKIKHVARRIANHVKTGERVIVVVSAMGTTTSTLLDLARQVSPVPPRRELDMLLSVGERMTMSLLAMALNDLNIPAVSLTGSQAGIVTTEDHENADILEIKPLRIEQCLGEGKTVIIAGFQGVSKGHKEITTLGRGGSDLTAVALAAHFNCPCEIVKERAAVYQADPQLFPRAKPLKELDDETLELMTQWGSQMLNFKAASLVKSKQVQLFFSSASGNTDEGTRILSWNKLTKGSALSHLSHRRALLKFTSDLSEASFQSLINKIYDERGLSLPEIQASSPRRSNSSQDSKEKLLNTYWIVDHPDTAESHIIRLQNNAPGVMIDSSIWMCFSLVTNSSVSPAQENSNWIPPHWWIQYQHTPHGFHQTLIFFPRGELEQAVKRVEKFLD